MTLLLLYLNYTKEYPNSGCRSKKQSTAVDLIRTNRQLHNYYTEPLPDQLSSPAKIHGNCLYHAVLIDNYNYGTLYALL
jgi:hypothetical protein